VAAQEVALTDAQLNVVDSPTWIEVGAARKVTIAGKGGAVPALTSTIAAAGKLFPAAPAHVRVYV
jgi:hypothetical protein